MSALNEIEMPWNLDLHYSIVVGTVLNLKEKIFFTFGTVLGYFGDGVAGLENWTELG